MVRFVITSPQGSLTEVEVGDWERGLVVFNWHTYSVLIV